MIGFERCSMAYSDHGQSRSILRNADLIFEPNQRVCVLATAGAGKTTIAHLMSGFVDPQEGAVLRDANISWPLGFAGVLHPAISGSDNVKILADLAGLPSDEVLAFVAEFSELAGALHQPVHTYSSTMRAQLASSLSIAMPAETYVVDTVIGAGKPAFRAKCEVALEQRLSKAGLFFITNSLRQAEHFGQFFFIFKDGRFEHADNFAAAKALFQKVTAQEDHMTFIADGLSEV